MAIYKFSNGPMPTTAAQAPVTTGTAIKTLLQLKPSTGVMPKVKAWHISFDGSAAGTPIRCELIEVDVAATVTAAVSADLTKLNDPNAVVADTSGVVLGTAATGYTATVEGTITAVRVFDVAFVAPTSQYTLQWPLGTEPVINISKFLRVRVTAPAAVNAYCWVDIEF